MPESSAMAPTTLLGYDYVTLTILTAVGYDFVLTFSNEVEYIWNKPWSWVSTLFIFVRYIGLGNLVEKYLPTQPHKDGSQGAIIHMTNKWTFLLFVGAANLVIILRVWAMYNRSRIILGTLLTLFSVVIIFNIHDAAIGTDLRNMSVVIFQTLYFSFCNFGTTVPTCSEVAAILQITSGAAMCFLAIVQFTRQSLQMYRVTKHWQLNRYMNLLVRQGILSFFAIFLFDLMNVLPASTNSPIGGTHLPLLRILQCVPMYTLTPRFILCIRELYARDVRRGDGIDSGFGLSVSGCGATGTEMMFVDAGGDKASQDVEGMQMETVTTQAA